MKSYMINPNDTHSEVAYCSYVPYDLNISTPGILQVTYADTHTAEYEVTYYSVTKDMVLLVLTNGVTMYINASQWIKVTFAPKTNNNNKEEH